eukprot:8497613-Pyramimonas_sp.AAC.1
MPSELRILLLGEDVRGAFQRGGGAGASQRPSTATTFLERAVGIVARFRHSRQSPLLFDMSSCIGLDRRNGKFWATG